MIVEGKEQLRDDYWPSYDEIDTLNKRIEDVESDLSIETDRLDGRINTVEGSINTLKNEMAVSLETSTLRVNVLNANHATIPNFYSNNQYTNNLYVENIRVNKPWDNGVMTNGHFDNATITSGNIYNANFFNTGAISVNELNSDNQHTNNLFAENISGNDLNVTNAVINSLVINKNIAPVTSSAVLGYTEDGRVIPVKATFDVSFPENANYLYTDSYGVAHAGTASTVAEESDNLITSHAVLNVANSIADDFNNVADNMNAVISGLSNDVSNAFNEMNNALDEQFNRIDDDLNNCVKYADAETSPISINNIYKPANVTGWVNSTYPINIQGINAFEVRPVYSPAHAVDVGDGAKLILEGTNVILALPWFSYEKKDWSNAFANCINLESLVLPKGIEVADNMFSGSGYTVIRGGITIPNSIVSTVNMFRNCGMLRGSTYIYSINITNMENMFYGSSSTLTGYAYIREEIPLDPSNYIYNCLVNNATGVNFTGKVINNLKDTN